MDDFEILDTLEENAKDEIVFKFTREIFLRNYVENVVGVMNMIN